ncbi:MAG: SPFH domain-containing protein [Methylacidiphilales bacterium]|nr:SPFH domain-containing protein [Candidatus Methylacidiphilales bacterium]
MAIVIGIFLGFLAYLAVKVVMSIYTVDQNERAVLTTFGRAERLEGSTLDDPIAEGLNDEEKQRYNYPQLRVIGPGGPYFKLPWQRVYKISVATQTLNIAFDPESASANNNNQVLEAVTKDQLNTGLVGQLRYTISERNLYATLFAVKNPIAHVMGYFVSVLRERIANFDAPQTPVVTESAVPGGSTVEPAMVQGISINDLRKNLRELNEQMDQECATSSARYGIRLDAALITSIDPPPEVESALAAINTAHNQVSSDISVAQAAADQRIVQSKRAVEIETLKAQAEVEPLNWLAAQLAELRKNGPSALPLYLRNIRLALYAKASHIILEMKK